MGARLTEAQFIYYGLRKNGHKYITLNDISEWIENPNLIEYVEEFFYYFDWYWDMYR